MVKTRIFLMIAAAGLAGSLADAGEVRIAVVNGSRVLQEYYKTEMADTHIQQQVDDFSAERDKLMQDHKKLKQDFESLRAEAENKALTDEARDKKRELAEAKLAEVIESENSIREKATTRKKQIEGEGRKIHAELAKAIKNAVKVCAEKNGYTLVLEGGGLLSNGLEPVLYSEPKGDITTDVLKLLNADKPAGKE